LNDVTLLAECREEAAATIQDWDVGIAEAIVRFSASVIRSNRNGCLMCFAES
jgi:hypothetical protein